VTCWHNLHGSVHHLLHQPVPNVPAACLQEASFEGISDFELERDSLFDVVTECRVVRGTGTPQPADCRRIPDVLVEVYTRQQTNHAVGVGAVQDCRGAGCDAVCQRHCQRSPCGAAAIRQARSVRRPHINGNMRVVAVGAMACTVHLVPDSVYLTCVRSPFRQA
jgi:hypothetical protein